MVVIGTGAVGCALALARLLAATEYFTDCRWRKAAVHRAMAVSVRCVEYYYATVDDRPGQAAQVLQLLAESGVDLLAFSVVPSGATHTQLMLFPAVPMQLLTAAKRANLEMTGPQHALLVQGDNELGALVEIHQTLAKEGVNIYASTGVTDTHDGFGYLLYVRPEDFTRAARLCGVSGAPTPTSRPPLL